MSIDIFSNYKVKISLTSSGILQEDSAPGDIVYVKNEYDTEEILNGGVLIERIAKLLLDNHFCDMSIIDNTLRVITFNHYNGTGDDYVIVIERCDNNETN